MKPPPDPQLGLFTSAAPLPSAAPPGDVARVRPEHTPVAAELAEPPVPAPVDALRALDAALDAHGPPLSPAWPERAPPRLEAEPEAPPPVEHHDGLDVLRVKMHEIETRGAGGRKEAARPVLPSVLADDERTARRVELVKAAGLAGEQKDMVRRLQQKVLLDDRTWLDLLVDACRAELVDGAGLAKLLKASLQRGRLEPAAMLARSRFFWTVRQLSEASYPDIVKVWGVRDHNLAKYGHDAHERRLAAERATEDGDSAPKPPASEPARWVERDAAPPPLDVAELPPHARAS